MHYWTDDSCAVFFKLYYIVTRIYYVYIMWYDIILCITHCKV